MKPAFDRASGRGTLTAGNSSPLTDGAAAIWVATDAGLSRLAGAAPRVRLLDFEMAAIDIFNEGLLMAYVPTQKLLIQADAFSPRPGAAPLPKPSPYTTNLVENVERLKLDVQRVAHVHGGVSPWDEVLAAASRVPTKR